jgi:hypothetical protein
MPRIDHVAVTTHDSDGAAAFYALRDPDGRQLEAITYRAGEDPRGPD